MSAQFYPISAKAPLTKPRSTTSVHYSIPMGGQMFSRKPFVKLGAIMMVVAAGCFFGSGAFAADSVTKGLGSLSVQATGTAASVSAACPKIPCVTGHACICMTGTYSIVGNNGFNRGTGGLVLSVDLTNLGDPITAFPACAPATGFGNVSDRKGNQMITFLTSGQACETGGNNPGVFNGSYVIDGGLGKYSSATGAGTIGASGPFLINTTGNPVPSQASFNGSVQP